MSKKFYIAVGYYYGGPFVDIFKDININTAQKSAESNGSDPIVMKLDSFQKLYNKAYDCANVKSKGK